MYPSQDADKYVLRFPPGLRDRIKRSASINHRTMNAEMVHHLEAAMKAKGQAEAPTSPSHDQNHPSQKDGGIDA